MCKNLKQYLQDESDQNEIEGAELIDKNADKNTELPSKMKLPNPFRKSKVEEDGK